jgi:hypothetical protein
LQQLHSFLDWQWKEVGDAYLRAVLAHEVHDVGHGLAHARRERSERQRTIMSQTQQSRLDSNTREMLYEARNASRLHVAVDAVSRFSCHCDQGLASLTTI